MSIVGDLPSKGLRLTVARGYSEEAPWSYRGEVATPEGTWAIELQIDGGGEVSVHAPAGVGPGVSERDLLEKIRLIARTSYRQSKADGDAAPPRKIVRWRGEK